MIVGDPMEQVASYVPARVTRQFARDPSHPDGPLADRFTGAVLLADISGFTALTESLARRGARLGAVATGAGQGEPPFEVKRLLADALNWFTEGRETTDLRQAAVLLSRKGRRGFGRGTASASQRGCDRNDGR